MNRKPLIAVALAAAVASPLLAHAARDDYRGPVIIYERDSGPRERIIERDGVLYEVRPATPADGWVYDRSTGRYYLYDVPNGRDAYPSSRDPAYDPAFPQQGQRVERGLFNRRGPNDFGG